MHFPERLLAGYRAFRTGRLSVEQQRYRSLAEHGQAPRIMVVGCSDSRVTPEVIFDVGPGELFVVRNVANLVPPYAPDSGLAGVSAALEFAVLGLRVRDIVVMGHEHCGGVRAFAEKVAPLSPGDFIGRWMSLLEPVARQVGLGDGKVSTEQLRRLEQAAVLQSVANLMTFPPIRARVEARELALHAAYFGIANGRLAVHDPASGRFEPVAAE